MDEQLLVLGNGFDLNVGLKSSFEDYFNQRFPNMDNQENDVNQYDLIEFSEYNMWDIIVRFVRNYKGGVKLNNWSDLEELLFDVMCSTNEYSNNPLLKYNLIDKLCEVNERRDRKSLKPIWKEPDDKDFIFKQIIRKACVAQYDLFYMMLEGSYSYGDMGFQMATILLKELNKMEEDFSSYLSKQVQFSSNYEFRSKMLLEQLAGTSNLEKTNILSFNYTNPFINIKTNNYRLIHGNLVDRNVIFGLDVDSLSYEKDNDDKIYFSQFSKQNRVIDNLFKNKKQDRKRWHFDAQKINQVIFFGHSLSEADYFYFQALFDSINLYSSDTTLIFVYSVYDKKKTLQIEESYKNSIETMLRIYGKSFDNQTHGRNLIQKLILENRLLVRCFE
ncbi:AbiH family protein [uncultured Fructobacillus sp.]|uniref:AbiH family protein n=2 Tax=Fructobacillus TaxID=559173 RepID=UPI0025970E42|nr:AbiH family protein [uncultured Fructobacillus sp.]